MLKPLTLCLIPVAAPAIADLQVTFTEGAPKDRFTLSGTAGCPDAPARLTIDLSTAPSGLIFDVSQAGAGVDVSQPLDVTAGANLMTTTPAITDGQQTVTFDLTALTGDPILAFTIDIDDTTSNRQITVDGSEIAGAQITLTAQGTTVTGTFTEDAVARLTTPACTS